MGCASLCLNCLNLREEKDKSDKLREIAKQKLLCPYCLKLLYIGKFRARTLETKVT